MGVKDSLSQLLEQDYRISMIVIPIIFGIVVSLLFLVLHFLWDLRYIFSNQGWMGAYGLPWNFLKIYKQAGVSSWLAYHTQYISLWNFVFDVIFWGVISLIMIYVIVEMSKENRS